MKTLFSVTLFSLLMILFQTPAFAADTDEDSAIDPQLHFLNIVANPDESSSSNYTSA